MLENPKDGTLFFELKVSQEQQFDLVDARAEIFQEATTLFEIPTRGPVLGIQCLDNGTTVVVSRSSGLEVILVDVGRGVYVNLDPYTMVTGNGDVKSSPTAIQISQLHAGNVLLYDRLQHSICVMNIDRRTCMHARVDFPLNGKLSTVVCGLQDMEWLVCTAKDLRHLSQLIYHGKSTSVNLNFSIANAFAADLGLWMVTSIENNYYALHIAVTDSHLFAWLN